MRGNSYVLGYPNREVRKAMFDMVLPMMLKKETAQVNTAIQNMKMAINGGVDSASSQISNRHYADAFVASKKKVTCLALEFSKESRGLKNWEIVE